MSRAVQSWALGSLGRRNGSSTRLAPCFRRQFHSTPAFRINALFTDSRDSELGSALQKIQDTLIAPAYLSYDERKTVFGRGGRPNPGQGPVVVNIDGLEYKFTLNEDCRAKFSWSAWNYMLNLGLRAMQKADDWSNLPTLLAGFKKARIRLPGDYLGRIARYVGTSGNVGTVIECAKQADETGFLLTNLEVVVRILLSANSEMVAKNCSEAAAKQTVSRAETVLDLLQRPEHSQPELETRDKLHMSRLVRGLVLFARASAVRAKQAPEQSPDDNDLAPLRDEMQLLASLWKDSPTDNLVDVKEFARMNPVVEARAIRDGKLRFCNGLNSTAYLEVLAQVRQGIVWTRALVGAEADELAPVQDAMDKHARQFVQQGQDAGWNKPAWTEAWERITGEKMTGEKMTGERLDGAAA